MLPITISKEELESQLQFFNKRQKHNKQAHGFNSAPDKDMSGNNFYIMTEYISGYHYELDSNNKRRKIIDYKSLFENLDEAFQFANYQRQVFTGLNHLRRDIVVVDIDDSYEPCFSEEEYTERIKDIKTLCNFYSIYEPSYVEFHLDSGHCQVGWYLSEYFTNYNSDIYKSNLYKFLCKSLAKILHADECFRGGNIKNPYNCKNKAFFFDKKPVNSEIFLNQVRSANELAQTGIIFPEKQLKPIPVKHSATLTVPNVTSADILNSRNCYAFTQTRTWLFRYMRQHQGQLPSLNTVIAQFTFFETESLSIVNKPVIESESQIRASAIGVYNFCKLYYKPAIAASIEATSLNKEVQSTRRYFSKVVRQAKKACRVLVAKKLQANCKNQIEISNILKCTQANVSILLKSSAEESFTQLKTYLMLHLNDKSEKHLNFFKEISDTCNYLDLDINNFLKEDLIIEAFNTPDDYHAAFVKYYNIGNCENYQRIFKTIPLTLQTDLRILYTIWETTLHSVESTSLLRSTA